MIDVNGRLHSTEKNVNIIAGADEILDDSKNKKQNEINTETYSLVNDINERLSGLSPDQQSALSVAAKATNNEIKLGYYVCGTEGNVAAKVISDATGYVLSTGGSIKVKMTNANTADNATLNINSTGAKPLYYDGVRASANNTWEAGETVEVYYNGTNFYANNVAGGGGDGVFNVSEKYPTSGVEGGNTYTLEGALAVLNANLSTKKKKGGMSIKFVSSSDNKYVQYRLMSATWSTTVANWQGVDDEPTAGSKNLITSGYVAKLKKIADDISRDSYNLFKKNKVTVNYRQPSDSYALVAHANYSASEFIPVEEGKSYCITSNNQGAFFKSAEATPESFYGSIGTSNTFTVPSTVKYVRLSILNTELDIFMMNEGSELLSYEPSQRVLRKEALVVEFLNAIENYLKISDFSGFIKTKLEDISRFVIGRKSNNLFDVNNVTVGKYQPTNVGYLIDQPDYSASDFIPIEVGHTYTMTRMSFAAFFDTNKSYVSSAGTSNTFTVPSGVAYIRLSVLNTEKSTFMMNEGNEILPFENYGILLRTDTLSEEFVASIVNIIKNISCFIEGITSKNLFDKSKATIGKYVFSGNGQLIDNAAYSASDFIPVEVGETYCITRMTQAAFYYASKTYKSSAGESNKFTIPNDVAFIRLSVLNTQIDTFMMNKGDELLPFESPTNQLTPESIPNSVSEKVGNYLQNEQNFIVGNSTNNLFDVSKAEVGKYVMPNTGNTVYSPTWTASDFIKVVPGQTYCMTVLHSGALYDSNKSYVSAAGNSSIITIPNGVEYIRVNVQNTISSTFMMNAGSVLLPFESAVPQLKSNMISPEFKHGVKKLMGLDLTDYKDIIVKHLCNPFIKTKIKLLGDSITAGVGGTGYSPTGETMKGGGKANVLTATCWSNMLYHYVDDNFNKDFSVPMNDEHIIHTYNTSEIEEVTWNITEEIEGETFSTSMRSYAIKDSNEVSGNDFVKFRFYGTHFGLSLKTGNYGKFKVFIDDVETATVDCYSQTNEYEVERSFAGLTEDYHNIVLQTTNECNEDATSKMVYILYLIIPKSAIVKPWGQSGEMSVVAIGRYESDDDIVLFQYGTNDRHTTISAEQTETWLSNAVNTVLNDGNVPIIMCANPCSYEWEYNVTRRFHMWDVRNVVELIARKYGIPFVDNYTAFLNYTEQHEVPLMDLLSEGLHPNDLGYKVMYENIMKTLGLSLIPNYSEQT